MANMNHRMLSLEPAHRMGPKPEHKPPNPVAQRALFRAQPMERTHVQLVYCVPSLRYLRAVCLCNWRCSPPFSNKLSCVSLGQSNYSTAAMSRAMFGTSSMRVRG